jgi:hypothetical protein
VREFSAPEHEDQYRADCKTPTATGGICQPGVFAVMAFSTTM